MRRTYFFVRHARAVYQDRGFSARDYPPNTDWPLSPHGPEQARALAPWLLRSGVRRVVSSDLRRARRTAREIAEEAELPYQHAWSELDEVSPRRLLQEDARGPITRALGHRSEGFHAVGMGRAMRRLVEGGAPEPYRMRPVLARIETVLGRLDALEEPRVAVVSHGYMIALTALAVRGRLRLRWVDNCTVTRIDADGRGGYRLVSFAQRV